MAHTRKIKFPFRQHHHASSSHWKAHFVIKISHKASTHVTFYHCEYLYVKTVVKIPKNILPIPLNTFRMVKLIKSSLTLDV